MRLEARYVKYNNNIQNNKNHSYVNQNIAVKPVYINFQGLQSSKGFKALILSVVALFSGANIYAKANEALTKVANKIPVETAIKNKIPKVLCQTSETLTKDYNPALKELTNDLYFKYSYYFEEGRTEAETIKAKLDDYKKLLNDIPENTLKQGLQAIAKYKESIISILQTCSEYGSMYIKNIPDKENMTLHAEGLKRLSVAAKKIQGCDFKNAALFNGFSAEELMTKVVIPNEKVANGEVIGKNQNTLIVITNQLGCDRGKAFKQDFSEKTYLTKHLYFAPGVSYDFDESFLGHYGNILVIQPQGNADNVLNQAFNKIEKSLFLGAKTDIIYIAHENKEGTGVQLTYLDLNAPKSTSWFDTSDFNPVENGGQPFTQSIANIFRNSIDQGYNPRFIGNGCESEFLQSCINKIMGKDTNEVHLFTTPFDVCDVGHLGFSKNRLSFITFTCPFFQKQLTGSTKTVPYEILAEITELDKGIELGPQWYRTGSFLLHDNIGKEANATGLDKEIIDMANNGIQEGRAVKPNGMALIYRLAVAKKYLQ